MTELGPAVRPFRDIFTELTIEAGQEGLAPFNAYVRMHEKMEQQALRVEDYCSSSITSGGHARDESLAIQDIISRNTDTALDLGDELFRVGQLNPQTAVEAVTLGKLPWKQSEYMTFWLATMSGLNATGPGILGRSRSFQNDLEAALGSDNDLNMETYDAKLPAERRAPHYFTHASIFAAIAKRHDPTPVHRLVRLVDPDMSLGAQTENVFAREMGTAVFKVALAETGISPNRQNLPPRLVDDMSRLIRFGAAVFDTVQRQQIILVPQPE